MDLERLWIQEANEVTIHHDFPELDALAATASTRDLAKLTHIEFSDLVESVTEDAPRYPLASQDYDTTATTNDQEDDELLFDFGHKQKMPYGVSMVKAPALWERGLRGQGVTVCVIDSGVDARHPDFATGHLMGLPSPHGWPWHDDAIGHGTHVTGTIAAAAAAAANHHHNGTVVGVAPNATVHVVRVLGDHGQHTYASDVMAASQECVDAGASVINLSLGGSMPNAYEFSLLENLQRNVILVGAAGESSQRYYPASYPSVLSVSAIDRNQQLASFVVVPSNHNKIDLVAPGVDIWSTLPQTHCEICSILGVSGHGKLSGTSVAAPHVSGVVALLLSMDPPPASVEAVRRALQESAQDLPFPAGHGLVNAEAAYKTLRKELVAATPTPTTPTVAAAVVASESASSSSSTKSSAVLCPLVGQVSVGLMLRTDAFPEDTTITLVNTEEGNKTIWDYRNLPARQQVHFHTCIEQDQCHILTIHDGYGDGLCCKHGMGGYQVFYNDQPLESGAIFTDKAEVQLGPCNNHT